MDMRWNLDKLYTSFDCEALKNDFELLPKLIQGMNNFMDSAFTSTEDAKEKLEKHVEMYTRIQGLTDKLYSYGYLIYSVDTKNMTALKQIEKVESYMPQLTMIEAKFKKWLNGLDALDGIIASSDILEEHRFVLEDQKKLAQYLLSDQEEELIAQMQNTGSNAWSKLQDTVTSSLLVDYEDEKLPLPVIRNYAYDPSDEKKKKKLMKPN